MKLTEEYQYKRGITFARTDGRIYGNLKIAAVVFYVYQMVFSVMLLLGLILVANSLPVHIQNTIISMVLYTAALVLMFFKANLLGLLLNIVATVFKALPLIPMQILNSGVVDIVPSFYWQHLIPVVLVLIVSVSMCVISTREKYLIRRDYKVVLGKLYAKYHNEDMTEAEWEEFVDNYEDK